MLITLIGHIKVLTTFPVLRTLIDTNTALKKEIGSFNATNAEELRKVVLKNTSILNKHLPTLVKDPMF